MEFLKNDKQIDYTKFKNIVVTSLSQVKQKDILDNINPQNILSLITCVMVAIDKNYKSIPGIDKKQLCLNMIFDFINESRINKEKKNYILMIISDIYDTYVENIIKVSKGEISINKITPLSSKILKFFKKIFCNIKK